MNHFFLFFFFFYYSRCFLAASYIVRGEKKTVKKRAREDSKREREREGESAGNEIKLETWNISPLGAVAILRTISIRDVVIVNERNVSQNGWEHFRFFFRTPNSLPSLTPSNLRARFSFGNRSGDYRPPRENRFVFVCNRLIYRFHSENFGTNWNLNFLTFNICR